MKLETPHKKELELNLNIMKATEKIGDPDTISKSRQNDRGSGHNVGELLKRKGI